MKVDENTINRIVSIAKSYGATRLILFGSAAESPETARDLDIACDGVEGWEIFGLGGQIEEELNVPVDIVPLSPPTRFTRYIESWGKVLL
ncbi:MAG: nucleotidyltransferase domain-containing protein [bacterium]